MMTQFRDRLRTATAEVTFLSPIEALHIPSTSEIQLLCTELTSLQELQRKLSAAQDVVSSLEGIEAVEIGTLDTDEASKLLTRFNDLSALQRRYRAVTLELASLSGVEDFESIDFDEARAHKAVRALEFLGDAQVRLETSRTAVATLEAEHEALTAEAVTAAADVSTVLAECPECPTCGSTTEHSHV